ncbi:C4-dicarboxylate ABC transporter [Hydrogenophaga sp. 5NK40-0174]|uniref:SLAC1 family transporter n=1 Tax=Hydrogenophaga sp. 5NK40-0174 TaxID=3127649 RepID=UPI0031084C2A
MSSPTPLKFLMPGWFAPVMGLSGLALAWHRAAPVLGDMANGIALVVGVVAAVAFLAVLAGSVVRAMRYPAALAEDLRHPIRHAFVAALPVSLLLLATVGVALAGAEGPLRFVWDLMWWAGSIGQVAVTIWVLSRWIAHAPASPATATPGMPAPAGLWPAVTPVLLIPVVGNVVAPLAGLPLGHGTWSSMQFGIGVFFWPIVFALILVRRMAHSPVPERIVASWFITIAPPAVIGLVLMQMKAPMLMVQAVWGIALFFLLWLIPVARRVAAQPFGVPFWAMSFPLAALASFTLNLSGSLRGSVAGNWTQTLAVLMLAAASVVILWLCFATVRGLRDGSLLAPEPVANIVPAAA